MQFAKTTSRTVKRSCMPKAMSAAAAAGTRGKGGGEMGGTIYLRSL